MLNKRHILPAGLLAALILLALAALLPGTVLGQTRTIESLPFDGRVQVIAVPGDGATHYVPPPESALRAPATANIVVNYNPGFSTEAQQAFEYAVQIWESIISSPVPIEVDAYWEPLGTNVLGAAGPFNAYRDFPGAPMPGTWYPAALADKLYGQDIGGLDIEATFNSDFNDWYFGIDHNPPIGKLDFVSVVLHELGHGLGFLGVMNVSSGTATVGSSGYPFAYDRFAETGSGVSLLALNPTLLYDALTGDNVFFDGPNARVNNNGQPVKLYAPPTWRPGSSYSHVDDIYDGTANALMTWSLADGEAIHSPGPVALGILWDTGWTTDSNPPTAEPPATATSSPTPTRTVTPLANPASIGFIPQAQYDSSKDNITPPPPATNTPSGPTATATHTQPAPGPTPTATNPPVPGSIYGTVTEGGAAASGVPLLLRHSRYDSGLGQWIWETIATTSTTADGSFSFTGLPTLGTDEAYNVTYNNAAFQLGRLWVWQTPHLSSYNAGGTVHIGDFDIADVMLVSPAPAAAISLPATFSWQTRPATPEDRYAFDLYDDLVPPTEFITDPLGYVGSYTLTGIPAGFTSGIDYYWDVYVFTPDFNPADPWSNGWGWSLDYRQVQFLAASQQLPSPPGSPALPAAPDPAVDRNYRK